MKTATCLDCQKPFEYEPAFFDGKEVFLPYFCPACVDRRDREAAAEKERDVQGARRESWRALCPAAYLETDPADPRLNAALRAKLASWTPGAGTDLILCGPTGIGKTRLSFSRLFDLHMEGKRVFALSSRKFERMVGRLWANEDLSRREASDVIDSAREAQVLLLDDVGKEALTPRVIVEFSDLIEQRTSQKRRTIYTLNCSMEALKTRLGAEHGGPTIRRMVEFSEIVTLP